MTHQTPGLSSAGHAYVPDLLSKLAFIRVRPVAELQQQVATGGLDSISLKSHEVITCLVLLESETGIDPTKRDVLRDCGKQTLGQLVAYISQRAKAKARA